MSEVRRTEVLVVGGGLMGASVARELSQYEGDVTLVEKEADVSSGISKYATGIMYIGLLEADSQIKKSALAPDAPLYDPDSPRLQAIDEGYRIWEELFHMLDIPHRHQRISVVARDSRELEVLKQVEELAPHLGTRTPPKLMDGRAFREIEPNIGIEGQIAGALVGGDAMKIDPWEAVIALAENARDNGVKLLLNTEVRGISLSRGLYVVETTQGTIETEFIVNAAGKYGDWVADMAGARDDWGLSFIYGTRLVLDKRMGELIGGRIGWAPVPGATESMQLNPSGTIIVCCAPFTPTEDREDIRTRREEMRAAFGRGKGLLPRATERDVINSFVGVTPFNTRNPAENLVEPSRSKPKFIHAAIRFPGFAPAPAEAKKVVDFLADQGLELVRKGDFNPHRKGIPRFSELSDEKRDKLISQDSRYGRVVCRCETVTEGEIVEAIRRGATTVQGVSFRTRAGMGRCQKGFCGPRVVRILARELGIPMTEVTYKGGNSRIMLYWAKELLGAREAQVEALGSGVSA